MPQRLDAKDQRILSALSENARQSLSSIGRRTGLSEEVVNYRLRNLLQRGVIRKFRAEIDTFRIGLKTYRIYMRLEGANAKKESEIYEYLEKQPGAEWIAACEGRYNIIFRFVAEDEFDLNDRIDDISEKFSEYIREKDVTIPLKWHFYHSESGTSKPGGPKYSPPERRKRIEIDGKDWELLGILADDARIPTTMIAKKMGLTPNAVKYRIKKLVEERILTGYEVVIERTLFGLYHYKLLISFQNAREERIKQLVRYCESLPNIVYLVRSIGPWDMDIDFDFRNTLELHNSVLELTSKFRDLVRNYETIAIFKANYYNQVRGLKKLGTGL